MPSLDHASLNVDERRVLGRFVEVLGERLGDELGAVWLFGSRARGEAVGERSDIDVLVLIERASWRSAAPVYEALHDAARDVSLPNAAWSFSVHVRSPEWLEQRRAVESLFISEVERDHIDLLAAA